MKTIITLLLYALPMVGQTVLLTDNSAAGNPMPVSGSVTFSPGGTASCSFAATNNSTDKSIVAFAYKLALTKPGGGHQLIGGGGDRFMPSEAHRHTPNGPVDTADTGKNEYAGPAETFQIHTPCEHARFG
jgi:hypothetical protein